MRRLGGSRVPLEEQDFDGWLDKAAAPSIPTTVIYSKRDIIVSTGIARLPKSSHAVHAQMDSSHVAFAMNPRALGAVATILERKSA